MAEVESFTLDHTAVKAPYVRLINVEAGPKGDQISNFDVRLLQPNAGEIPTSGLHTIEHLLASLLRDRIDGVIDCSPFGCRTGFHLIMWGTPSVREVTEALASSLHAIAEEVTWEDVRQLPRPLAVQCPRVEPRDPRAGLLPRRLRARRRHPLILGIRLDTEAGPIR